MKFKNSWVNQSYISFLLIYRICLGIYLSYQNENWQATLFCLGFQIFFILYFIINLPYKSTLHNYRSGIIHLTTFSILLSSNYYRSMKMNTSYTEKSRAHGLAIIELAMIGLSVGISSLAAVVELYQFIKDYKTNKQKKKINIERT